MMHGQKNINLLLLYQHLL